MNADDEINAHELLLNNMPVDDFLGLTRNEMHYLLYQPLGEHSAVKLRKEIPDDVLDNIPFFSLTEAFLRILERDKQIKLTKTGALPRIVLWELYQKKIMPDAHIESGLIKLSKEIDWLPARSIRPIMQHAGLLMKRKGHLLLTKKGEKLVSGKNRTELFKIFLETFANKFAWSYNDYYTDAPVAQFGWAYSVILLHKFGHESRPTGFYAEKFLDAFPTSVAFFEPGFSSAEEYFADCYILRTIQHFFLWLGCIAIEKQKMLLDIDGLKCTKTDILDAIFAIET